MFIDPSTFLTSHRKKTPEDVSRSTSESTATGNTPVTNANAPVASMKDSGVLAGRGGGDSSLSQQSGLKRSEVK